MGFEDEYMEIQKKSWVEPVEQVNTAISVQRKKLVPHHSKENHDFMMKRFGNCLYCDNKIPIEDTSIQEKK